MNNICDLKIGQRARVGMLTAEGAIRRRLQDIGLIEGTAVECVLKASGGEIAAYLIRGALIALRREDAARIPVSV